MKLQKIFSDERRGKLMMIDIRPWEFFLAGINLLILFFILRKVLFKPLTEFMEKRADNIRKEIDAANREREDAIKMKEEFKTQIDMAKKEAENIIKLAKEKGQEEYEEIIKTARCEADMLKTKAQREIEAERVQMIEGMKGEIVELALAAASKVIEANMDNDKNRKLVEEAIRSESVA